MMSSSGFSITDTVTKVIGALTAVIALVTAYLTYRHKRLETQSPHKESHSKTSLTLLEVDYGPVKGRRWTVIKWMIVKWSMIPLGLMSLYMTAQGVYVLLFRNIPVGLYSTIFLERVPSRMDGVFSN